MEPVPASLSRDGESFPRPIRTEYKLLAELRVREPGIGIAEAAKRLGFSYQTVYLWTKKPDYQAYETWLVGKAYEALPPELRATAEDVRDTFQSFAGEMQERLLALLDTSQDPKLQAQIAQDWLDRAGHAPLRKAETRGLSLVLTPELYEMLRSRAAEAKLIPEAESQSA